MLPGTNHPECRLLLLQDKLARINALTMRAPPRALFLFVPLLVEQPARRFRRPESPGQYLVGEGVERCGASGAHAFGDEI